MIWSKPAAVEAAGAQVARCRLTPPPHARTLLSGKDRIWLNPFPPRASEPTPNHTPKTTEGARLAAPLAPSEFWPFTREIPMRSVLWLAALAVPVALLATRAGAGGEAPPFFNGKDLAGWEGLEEHWKFKDGALIGTHDGLKYNTFLCSKRKFKDFELKFQVKLTGKDANSGVQIRSKIINDKTFAVGGPQCDMGQHYWACLYGEHYEPNKDISAQVRGGMMKAADAKVVKEVLKVDDFNDYYIKCVGNHVTIRLNGATTVDDDFVLPEDGIIAWQLHSGAPLEVIFRKIEFTDLSK
jgi:hypothetical protein